jgi:hypothetical protein
MSSVSNLAEEKLLCVFNEVCNKGDIGSRCILNIRRVADKSLAFPICSTTKRIFLDRLKKLEERGHKCVGLLGGDN